MPRSSSAVRKRSKPRPRYSSAKRRSPLRRHTRPILLNATAALVFEAANHDKRNMRSKAPSAASKSPISSYTEPRSCHR